MRKLLPIYLIIISGTYLQAYTNKTHLNLRSQDFTSYIPHSLWKNVFHDAQHTVGRLSITPFATLSGDRSGLAKYFMFDNKTSLEIGRGASVDIDHRHLQFNETSASNLTGTLEFAPHREQYGFRIDYHQELKKVSRKLFIDASLPILRSNTDMKIRVRNATNSSSSNSILDYFRGNEMLTIVNSNGTFVLQTPLQYGKMGDSQDKSGVADLNVALGYHLANNEKQTLNLKGILNLPIGTSPRSEFVFEPVLGTGGAYGIGAAVDGYWRINDNFSLIYDLTLRYITSDDQKRIIGLKDRGGNRLNFAQYMLIGKIGRTLVIPGANLLRQTVEVKGTAQVEGMLIGNGRYGGFITEAGCRLFYKQGESVKRKSEWDENTYAFPGSDYAADIVTLTGGVPQEIFELTDSNLDNTINSVNTVGATAADRGNILASQLDTSAAETPQSFSVGLFFSLGHVWDKERHKYVIGAGAGYEIATSNSALNELVLWGKAGFTF